MERKEIMKKRVISLLLVVALLMSSVPAVFATEGPLSLTASGKTGKLEGSFAPSQSGSGLEAPSESNEKVEPKTEGLGLTKYESSEQERFSQQAAAKTPAAEDLVTFIVVTEDQPQLEKFSVHDIAAQTMAVRDHARKQAVTLDALKASVSRAFGGVKGFKLGYTYTIATTGFSVTTAYGNKAQLEAMEGVKNVYVAPTFTVPEVSKDQLTTFTSNATNMIGADVLNTSGYTGKGMRVAILDTGIVVDHPSFAALADDVLVDPMTRESVDEIWDTLNAGQMTNKLNRSYYNSKIPFIFNYVTGEFNVENTFAGSDHGTHVAGIIGANKTADTNVIGVAPDAQLVVMQVFQQGGGASWDTVMAALEDCVRLDVDAANLSLGMAAGFTDLDNDLLETVNLFLESDIQLLIAAGNDTNNAYMNSWGGDMSLITDPDIGLVGTPATYSAAMSVASADNNGYEQLYITAGGENWGILDGSATEATSFVGNFRNQELEYVVIPGYGAAADYEGLDVTGKIALVSRGENAFTEKQEIAQAAGAIGCVVYNNTTGVILMFINDGEGHIPCVSITQQAGQFLIEQAGEDGIGTFTVCDADMKLFQLDNTISSFSSWGCTPDLKLKPEITGVGGSIYSTVDPAISGSNFGYMSGTSMATPQISGAMAVLIQYMEANYPGLSGVEKRKAAANLLMSTADPIMATKAWEVSPRAQGAGLANLVSATTSGAYLSNPDASEGRPKVEFGDDPDMTGKYDFTFEIHNLTDTERVYEITSSVLTESIVSGYFIGNSPMGLDGKVYVDGGNTVTVPANGKAVVKASLILTDNDKLYLQNFPNGMFVEGYLYATPVTEDAEGQQSVRLVMPMLGYFGDWSDPALFDYEGDFYSLYPRTMFTYKSQLGTNPYFRNGKGGDEYNAFSYSNPLAEIDFGQLRNAKRLEITVYNTADPSQVYYEEYGEYMVKTYFNASYGMIIPTYLMVEYGEVWDGKDKNGNKLPDGTTVTYQFDGWLDDGDDIMDDSWSFNVTLDTVVPQITNADDLQNALRFDGERTYLNLDILENQHIAALIFQRPSGAIMGKYELENVPGETLSGEYEITGFGNEFTIIVGDYACNETEVSVVLDLGEQNNAVPTPAQLDKDRIYGCENFDSALVEGGWFSAVKADLSDPKNETFDSSNRYYAAEFVNGYIIAQSTLTGHLELVVPNGSYWSSTVICENNGKIGESNVWVLYDMALDHSGTLSVTYGTNWETNATDALLAVGWLYKGDNDNDGHDDGYNALFNIKFTDYGEIVVQEIGRIWGVAEKADLLTVGITTDGKPYGIDTNGILYSISTQTEWNDDAQGNVVPVTEIGVTDFVNYPNYGGANVIQSMGYDHNTGTMYWFAHSQVPSGYSYENINVTYAVNLETAECTEVGTYGPGGQTCLFVPNDLESDLFTMGVQASNMEIDPFQTYLVEGQTNRLKIKWTPWNAAPADVTWASLNESIVTVDAYGYVTALTAGTTTITASAEIMLSGHWEVIDGEWTWFEPAMGVKTVECKVTVIPSEDGLYGYVVEDFGDPSNMLSWVTYSDKTPHDITNLGQQLLPGVDEEGNEVMVPALWQGGTYYNGYVYTMLEESWVEDDVIYAGTALYRSKVNEGATPAETTFGDPEKIGVALDVKLGSLGFDYNTGRMYVVDLSYGGLGILDLDNGQVDLLGTFSGDCGGPIIATAMCVTADGTIVIADMFGNLYTVNPDNLQTRLIASTGNEYWFYAGMTYDYNTGYIYWNPCMSAEQSPLYLVMLPEYEWENATVVDMGDISTKQGAEQTVIFAIPENEPETKAIPVESIELTDGESITGLENGAYQLGVVTTPARPTVQTKTWTSSDESVVTVDRYGNLTYVGIGTATVTVSITNKDEATYGGPFTDSITVTVLPSAGEFVAFLTEDMNGSSYYDFWLQGNDYDLRHTAATESMISIYSLRTGVYYDGYFYGYSNKGQFLRIDADTPSSYKTIGNANLNYNDYQVTGMALDYTTGIAYGVTMPSNFNANAWTDEQVTGYLVTIDLDTGLMTPVAELDYATPVFALACDGNGQLYAAGGSLDCYSTNTVIYKLDKTTGALTEYVTIAGAGVYTGTTYYSTAQYNAQMTYDFGTDRLYLYATVDHVNLSRSFGMFMVQMGDEPVASKLDGISLELRGTTYTGNEVYLGLLAFIPEEDEIPVCQVNGIILNKTAGRVAAGETAELVAQVRPSNATDPSVKWESSDPSVATVDENGVVTGISAGITTITVTSNESGITAQCVMEVVDLSGIQNIAYTVSAQKDALISFNPAMPAQTAQVVCTLSGGSTIKGMTYGNNCLYYVVSSNYSTYLYRFDFLTKQSSLLGQLYTFTEPAGIAYDAASDMLYVAGGFYIFQFEVSKLNAADFNMYTNYVMDSDNCTLSGVICIDGAIYTFGNEYVNSRSQMMKYSDKYLTDRTVVLSDFNLNFVPGACDISYEPNSQLIYMADAGNTIFSMDLQGNVKTVDILGSGIDLNGFAIDPTPRYSVTFKAADGTILSRQFLPLGEMPQIPEAPDAENFTGWDKEVVACDGTATYTATYGTEQEDLVLGVGFSLSFEDEVLVNMYYTISGEAAFTDHGVLVFGDDTDTPDVANAEAIYKGIDTATAGQYMGQTDGISAKELGDTKYYAAYAKRTDGTYVYSDVYAYSPRQYALNKLASESSSNNLKALCAAMLNYGTEAQLYFSHNTDQLANRDLTDEQKALVAAYSTDLFAGPYAPDASKAGQFVKTAGFGSKTATASFNSALALNYYFQPTAQMDGDMTFYYWSANDYLAADVLTADNATGTAVMMDNKDGSYWAEIPHIAAKQMDDTYYVVAVYESNGETLCTGVISYTVSKYCMNRAASDSDMADLAAAAAVYGYHAKVYFTQG